MAVWSQIQKSELYGNLRLDAEFYQPDYLHADEVIRVKDHCLLGDVLKSLYRYPTFYGFEFVSEGVACLKGEDIDPTGFVSSKSGDCVPENISKRFPLTVLEAEDIIISVRGLVGKTGLIGPDLSGAQISPNLIRAKVNRKKIDPLYLWCFLTSSFGVMQFERYKMRTSQETIVSTDIKNFVIPLAQDSLQQNIRQYVLLARERKNHAESLIAEAEAILTAALGLDRMDLAPHLFYEDTFFHAADAGRFDPEYYQPAKGNVLRALAAMPGKPLEEHFRSMKKLWQPNEQPSTATVRNYDLTDALTPFLDDTTPTATAGEIKSTKKRFEPGDLVVSRLRSYLKEIAVVCPSTGAPLVGSTEFIVLRSRKTGLSAEALLVFLRSAPVQTVLKWCQDGSNHPRFAEKELLRLSVPDAVVKVQGAICERIREAITARQESRRLLDEAKRTVERAIEGGS